MEERLTRFPLGSASMDSQFDDALESAEVSDNSPSNAAGDGSSMMPPWLRTLLVGTDAPFETNRQLLALRKEDLELEVNRINFLWIFISCGYMVSWTSIGSLIAYFKARQGASFYVKLYCAFYLPGLPVSLLQQRYDEDFDRVFGSFTSFMVRLVLGMCIKVAILLFMPFIPNMFSQAVVPSAILVCMILIGGFSWLCHGTACMLCSMFPSSSTKWLQTGFRTPELYTVLVVSLLSLGSSASESHIILFYFMTALVVLLGLVSWIRVCSSRPARYFFALKDQAYQRSSGNDETSPLVGGDTEKRPWDLSSSSNGAAGAAEPGGRVESREYVAQVIRPARIAIFLNIASSIFSAAFFAYVKPVGKYDVEVILYFTRLFSDLVGRPLAGLPRPWFVRTMPSLVRMALLRMILMVIFFMYIIFPGLVQSDLFITCVVAVFFGAIGLFVCPELRVRGCCLVDQGRAVARGDDDELDLPARRVFQRDSGGARVGIRLLHRPAR